MNMIIIDNCFILKKSQSLHGEGVNVLDRDIIVSEFEF